MRPCADTHQNSKNPTDPVARISLRALAPCILSSLGITATILWCKLMGHTPGFALAAAGLENWANARFFWLLGICIMGITCLAMPRATRRVDLVLRCMVPLLAFLGALAFALAVHQDFFDQRMMTLVGLVISGFGYFWFISRFVLLLSLTQGFASVVWAFAAAFPLRQIILLALNATLTFDVQVQVAVVLPLIAALMFELALVAAKRCPNTTPATSRCIFGIPMKPRGPRAKETEKRYLVLLLLVLSLLLSIVRACGIAGVWGTDHTSQPDLLSDIASVAFMAVAIALFAQFALINTRRYAMSMRFQLGILLVVAGLFVAAMRPHLVGWPTAVLNDIVNINDPFALLLLWSAVATALVTLDLPTNRVVGIAGTVYGAASMLWVSLVNGQNAVDSVYVLGVLYVLFALVMMLSWHSGKSTEKTEAPLPKADEQASTPEAAPALDSTELLAQAIEDRCGEIATRYSLSPRETDVLLLLAQGRTGTTIQEELVLAASTVKTHMQHIYTKTGVKDRQELMDMVLGLKD